MALNAKLTLGHDYDVLECEYEFVQPIKENGQPAGRPGGGLIRLTVVSPDDSDLQLHTWMKDKTEMKDGKITFLVVSDSNKTSSKTLSFKDAYCIRLNEYFNGQGEIQMCTKLTISAGEISFGKGEEVTFKNDGKLSN
ncbi:MAG: type VI secretion system tube protein TssD [Dysgonomonas sp.]